MCKIMAFMAVVMGLGPLLYILWGLRYGWWLKVLGRPDPKPQSLNLI